ncbi:type II secretion system protein [Candidatus Falkowbacteria bacterium]|nr:type II secretion system protein [Candidatus Falkowbacteria bacterium]
MKIKHGFTLIETIVVIAIMSIIFAFLFVNFRGRENNRELENNALLVLDGLKRLQTMALAGETINGISPQYYFLKISNCSSGCSNYQLLA